MTSITLSKGGSKERTVCLQALEIPDLWHVAKSGYCLRDDDRDKVLEVWHIAHDLKRHRITQADIIVSLETELLSLRAQLEDFRSPANK